VAEGDRARWFLPPRASLVCIKLPPAGPGRRVWPGGAGCGRRRRYAVRTDRTDGMLSDTCVANEKPRLLSSVIRMQGYGGINESVAIGWECQPWLVLAATSDRQA
jgi:hypothetical protein